MEHKVYEMNHEHLQEHLEMASKLALHVIHQEYDCNKECDYVNSDSLFRIKNAVKTLHYIHSMTHIK